MNKIENVLVTRRYLITGAKRISNYWWASIVSFGGLAFFITGFASFLQRNISLFNQSKSISFFPQGLIMCFYGCLGLFFGFYLWCTIFWKVGDGFNEFNKNQGFVRIFRWGLPGKNRRIDFQYKIEDVEGVRVELKEGVNPRRVISLKIKGLASKTGFYNKMESNLQSKALVEQHSGVPVKNSTVEKQKLSETQSDRQSFQGKNKGTQSEALPAPVAKTGFSRTEDMPKRNVQRGSGNNKKDNNRSENRGQKESFTVPLTRVGQPISLEKIESQASELAQFLRVSLETSYLDS